MEKYHKTVALIRALLDEHGVTYKTFEHEPVRTSEEAAAIRPEYTIAQGAKALIVRIKRKVRQSGELSQEVASDFDVRKNRDNLNSFCKEASGDAAKQFVQIVVPGDCKFDPKKARSILKAKDIRFAHESEVLEITDGVMPGGVPPFGVLWGLPVFVEETLLNNDEIIFNSGDRRFSISMSSNDYLETVKPTVVSIV